MGIVSKRLHQRTTDQLAAPVRAQVQLTAAEVYAIADQMIGDYVPHSGLSAWWTDAGYHYRIGTRQDGSRAISCPRRAALTGGKMQAKAEWQAGLQVIESGPGERTIQLQLLRWFTRDGVLSERHAFEALRDEFFKTVHQADFARRRES
jgi:hypothetical protein